MMRRHLGFIAFVGLLGVCPLVLPEFYVTLLNYIGLSALVKLKQPVFCPNSINGD